MSLSIGFLDKLCFKLKKSPIQEKITELEGKIDENPLFSFASAKNPENQIDGVHFKEIDTDTWNRKQIFDLFSSNENPFCSVTARNDISKFLKTTKKKHIPDSHAMLYMLSKTANEIPEFKQRVVNGKVIEYDKVGITATVAKKDGSFNIQPLEYMENPTEFLQQTSKKIQAAKTREDLFAPKEEWQTGDNVVYSTCLPWMDFTSLTHPISNNKTDFIPRIAWGKYTKNKKETTIPVNIEANHSLVDGFHIAQFFQKLQNNLDNASEIFKSINKYDALK